jgi:4-hydroxy-3-methylbut-2-enyl diphosphate reductase
MGDRMKTIKISPRGYCHGVVNAINTITKLTEKSIDKKITILGMVIHNKQVIEAFEQKGIKTLHSDTKTRLELLDLIDEGIVVFTAHGVSDQVREKAKAKGLEVIDTSCTDVLKTQNVIKELLKDGHDIIYIGKHGHPESEAANAISEQVHLIQKIEEIKDLNITNPNISVTNQTTMSIFDIYQIVETLKKTYPNLNFVDEICNASRIRQEAVRNQSSEIDHCFVVGDVLSNNSKKLAQVSKEEAHIDATLIENVEDIDIEKLKTYQCVSVTSGASTPTSITNEVIAFLQAFDKDDINTHQNKSKITPNNLITFKRKHS